MTGAVLVAMGEVILPEPHAGLRRVLSEARRFNWLAAGRRWRKTTGFGLCPAVGKALEGGVTFWGAPTYDQVRVGWDEARRALVDVGQFNQGRMTITLPTGGSIIFRSLDDPDNARGHTADRVVLDEVAFLKPRSWYEVVRPMLIDTGGDLYAMSSPNGVNWFEHEVATASALTDAASWQAPTLGARVENGRLVRAPHPLENPDVSFAELESLFATMTERQFRQEILAEFVDAGDAVFRQIDIDMMSVGWAGLRPAERGRHYVTAWDIGRRGDPTVGVTLDVTISPYQVVAFEREHGMPYPAQQMMIEARAEAYPGVHAVEANGVGDPVIENLICRVQPFVTTARSKVDAITSLQLLTERTAIKADIPEIEREMRAYRWDDKALVQDCVMALAIAALHAPPPDRPTPRPDSAQSKAANRSLGGNILEIEL